MSVAGLAFLNLLIAGAGAGVLCAAGLADPTPRGVLKASGLALMTGIPAVMLPVIALMTLGVGLHLWLTCLLALAMASAGLVRSRRRYVRQDFAVDRGPLVLRAVTIAGVAVVAAFLVVALFTYAASPAWRFDEIAIWSKKAVALYYLGGLDPAVFAGPAYVPMHQPYPIMLPAFEATAFQAMGAVDTRLLHAELLVLYAAFIGAAAYLCARRNAGRWWMPVLALVAILPLSHDQLPTGYADIPVSIFAALGLLALGTWVEDKSAGSLAVGALLLAGAASIKMEGLVAGGAAFAAAAVITLAARDTDALRKLSLAAGAWLAVLAPWQIWVMAHPSVKSFFDFQKGFDVGFLRSNTSAAKEAWETLSWNMAHETAMLLVPFAIVLVLVAFVVRAARPAAAMYALTGLATLAALIWVYWTEPIISLDRVVDLLVFIAVAALLQLSVSLPRAGVSYGRHRGGSEPGS